MSESIDYRKDSLAEITLKQREIIEQQGYRILYLLSENLALKADTDSVISQEHERLMESLLVVEGWVFRWIREGQKRFDGKALHRILTECFAYSEDGTVPPWLEAGRRTLAEIDDEE